MKKRSIFRAVGFTISWFPDGDPGLGWTGRFHRTRRAAEREGCGVSGCWHHGVEIRERTRDYTRWSDGSVTIDGEPASDDTRREVLEWMRNH